MNEYKRAYFIGAAETAARTAESLFYTSPTFAKMSITLSYCYLLVANEHIEEAKAHLLDEPVDTKAIFEAVFEYAERLYSAFEF